MAKYSKKAQEKVKEAMEKMKKDKLTIGNSDKKVTSRKQAIAIGLQRLAKQGQKYLRRNPKCISLYIQFDPY